jgi:hypothetical protein
LSNRPNCSISRFSASRHVPFGADCTGSSVCVANLSAVVA